MKNVPKMLELSLIEADRPVQNLNE